MSKNIAASGKCPVQNYVLNKYISLSISLNSTCFQILQMHLFLLLTCHRAWNIPYYKLKYQCNEFIGYTDCHFSLSLYFFSKFKMFCCLQLCKGRTLLHCYLWLICLNDGKSLLACRNMAEFIGSASKVHWLTSEYSPLHMFFFSHYYFKIITYINFSKLGIWTIFP